MKKLFLSLALATITFASNAQDVPEKEDIKGEVSTSVTALRLASELVKYGYAQQSALPLVDALQIILDNPTQPMGSEKEGEKASIEVTSKNGNVTLNFDEILASAKKFAEGDDNLLAIIDQAETDAMAPSRGAVNGPKYSSDVVRAKSTDTYNVSFVKGYLAEVALSGDGDTDLDLYVYDSNGNLIASDTDYTDDCYVNWIPAWTGRYTIKVVNRGGVANRYVLVTN